MTREAVHAAATLGKRFESLLKRACKNYNRLFRVGAVEGYTVRREPPPEEEERTEYLDAVEEYEKLVEAFEKFVKLKAFEDFLGWSWHENFVKWAGKERISVGYSGVKRERSAEYFLMDIPLEYELPMDKTIYDLYKLYKLEYLENLKIPEQSQAEDELIEFLEYRKKWPTTQLAWLVKNVYPLTDKTGGFWTVASKILALASLRDAWEDVIEKFRTKIPTRNIPQFEVLKTVLGSEWEAERYLRSLNEELEKEFLDKYGMTTANVEDVEKEFYNRGVELLRERVTPEERVVEVYEQVKPLIPAEKVELTRGGLLEAIRWAFIHPQLTVDGFASVKIFPLMFTTEQAKEIAAKILEKVTKKPVPVEVPPPKIEFVKIRVLEDLPAIVGADLKTYGPFKKREVYELPKENAEALVKKGVAIYETVYMEEVERELATVTSEIEKLGKFERLAYFLNNRLKWRLLLVEQQKELLKKIVEGWTEKDYQTFYDMYPEKVKEVPPTFTLLGVALPPPPTVPETVPALREQLEEEEKRRREAELMLIEEKKKAEAVAPAVEVAPPPIKEPVPEEEQVVKRECYETFRRLWDEIKKTAAMEVGIPTVSGRTGIGASFIRKALAEAYGRQLEKIESLANELTECQCEIELKEKGAGHFVGVMKKCQNHVENQKKSA